MPRLMMAALLAAMPVSAQPHSRMSPKDQQALRDYDLTAGKIDKLMAVGEKMRAYAKAHPDVEKRGDFMRGKDLDESVKSIESKPELVSLMKSEGVAPRDFVVGMMSVVTAGMWAEMSKQYPSAQMPPEINPKNVKLMQEHPEILKKWEQAWSQRGRGGRGGPPPQGASDPDGDEK
ncbi:MAG: hypothetical protein ACXWLM_01695 [Myxococcales bacterium]